MPPDLSEAIQTTPKGSLERINFAFDYSTNKDSRNALEEKNETSQRLVFKTPVLDDERQSIPDCLHGVYPDAQALEEVTKEPEV